MATPLNELLPQVAALNTPEAPFSYDIEGDTVVGRWNIVSAAYLDLAGAGTLDEKYSVTVDFDEKKGTFDFTERKRSANTNATTGRLSGGSSTFKGKSSAKSFSFTLGGVNATQDGVSPVLAYSFETSRIKDPLFAFLEQHGWSRKKTFLGGLFAH